MSKITSAWVDIHMVGDKVLSIRYTKEENFKKEFNDLLILFSDSLNNNKTMVINVMDKGHVGINPQQILFIELTEHISNY